MNLQQLEYILAVDQHRHFVTAAEQCHVTQATLSMMIRKLEDEWQVKLFDRSKHPVIPTPVGERVIEQARVILREVRRLDELVNAETGQLKGSLRVGIIPTLAPYLLPLFLRSFNLRYPEIQLQLSELTTDEIVHRIKNNKLDAGILALPLHEPDCVEIPLFEEEFVVYGFPFAGGRARRQVRVEDLDPARLWLLDEGHCLRNQVIHFCGLHPRHQPKYKLAASGIETLKKVVDVYEGITILPALALQDLTRQQKGRIHSFRPPVPVRQIGLVCFRYVARETLLNALKSEILAHLPTDLVSAKKRNVVDPSHPHLHRAVR